MERTPSIVLQTEHLTKCYHKTCVLDDVSLSLELGHIYGLVGRNGAGKSTLMRIVCGLSFPTTGNITLFDRQDQKGLEEARRKWMGFLIEEPALYDDLTVFQNMKMRAMQKGIGDSSQLNDLIALVGLDGVTNRRAKKLSLGMRQRLGIGMSLIGHPHLLILDEPINGLDPAGIADIRQLLKTLREQQHVTMLLSSHILPEMYQVADTFMFIDKGRLIRVITQKELDNTRSGAVVIRVVNSNLAINALQRAGIWHITSPVDGELKVVGSEIDQIAETLLHAGVEIMSIGKEHETLEQFFMRTLAEGRDHDKTT